MVVRRYHPPRFAHHVLSEFANMDVRSPARRHCALALFASALACCSGCQWVKEFLEEPVTPCESSSGPDMAQLWEDGYGYNNPNGELIRSGKKKPGDKPNKDTNPYYESEMRERREKAKKRRAKPEFVVEEPNFSFD